MSAADRLLSRLQGVKAAGDHRWSARCPAHDDKLPSLSIREESDGRLLICCHAGCSAGDVTAAVGLELRDLFDAPLGHHFAPMRDPMRPQVNLSSLMNNIQHESLVVVIVAEKLARGDALADKDHRRLIRAANNIQSAVAKTVQREAPEMKRIRRGETPAS